MTKDNVDCRTMGPRLSKYLTTVKASDNYNKQNLFIELYEQYLKYCMVFKKNMKNILINLSNKFYSESIVLSDIVSNDLKNKMDIKHTRHRTAINAFIDIISTFIDHSLENYKSLINFSYSLSKLMILIQNLSKI